MCRLTFFVTYRWKRIYGYLAQNTAQNQPPCVSVRFSRSEANRELTLSG